MPANDQQLRAIAFLAAACRPHGAKRWDESGIYANLAKVRDRSLGSIVIAAIQAAEDRNAHSPGVLPTTGPHWRDPEKSDIPWEPPPDVSALCAVCSEVEARCRALQKPYQRLDAEKRDELTHEFRPKTGDLRLPADQAHAVVAELRDHKASQPPPRPEVETTTEGTERVAPVRAELAAARTESEESADV